MDYLISHGADINAPNSGGFTPLHIATTNNNPELVYYLIAWGANVNAQSILGETPLYIAAYEHYVEVLEALALSGANPLITTTGTTPQSPLEAAQILNDANTQYILEILEQMIAFATTTKFFADKNLAITTIFKGNDARVQKYMLDILVTMHDIPALKTIYTLCKQYNKWSALVADDVVNEQSLEAQLLRNFEGKELPFKQYQQYICSRVIDEPIKLIRYARSGFCDEEYVKKICCEKLFYLDKQIKRLTKPINEDLLQAYSTQRRLYNNILDEMAQKSIGKNIMFCFTHQKFDDTIKK